VNDDINRMDIAEFREFGYLQELSRCFLHPLGLTLEVMVDDDGTDRAVGDTLKAWEVRRG